MPSRSNSFHKNLLNDENPISRASSVSSLNSIVDIGNKTISDNSVDHARVQQRASAPCSTEEEKKAQVNSNLRNSTSQIKRRLSGTTAVPQRESMTITPRKNVVETNALKNMLNRSASGNITDLTETLNKSRESTNSLHQYVQFLVRDSGQNMPPPNYIPAHSRTSSVSSQSSIGIKIK